ncbi:PQQ-binding-like beta-propeller repeat protein [Ruania halotolerans]|uniref:outer membrane protein assembly factor BamB family protein n=1 Tax=Ruania halotolerans TaxID=2897773 RepID=UPI001E34870E|nr:PQQ-binding-like beta-propeller repeat protein [Ruania halotolerans]UFU08204.1 PQQ-binding-like beta-propeller repeat protein [Ruania halotolerans]
MAEAELAENADSKVEQEVRGGRRRPVFAVPQVRWLLTGVILGALGLATGVASIVLDLGRDIWILALGAAGVALVCVLSGTRVSTVIGFVAASGLVAGGIVAAGAAPALPPEVVTLPAFTPPTDDRDDVTEIGRDADVLVVMDSESAAVIGYTLEGDLLWSSKDGYGDGFNYSIHAGDSVITYPGRSGEHVPVVSLSTATGQTQWSLELGEAIPVAANEDVIVFADRQRVLAVDRQTGDQQWEMAGDIAASTEGSGSHDAFRWTAHADWIVVGDRESNQYQVLDARTGVPAAVSIDEFSVFDWAIAGDTFISFEFDGQQRVAVGTPLRGGDRWQTEVRNFTSGSGFYEPVGTDLRIATSTQMQWLDSATGELATVDLPTGWRVFPHMPANIDGARTLLVLHRDSDDNLLGYGLFDSRTGELMEVAGPYGEHVRVVGVTPSGTLVSLPYLDAVGEEHERTVLVPDPS